jgi:hypothetical protein
MKRSAEQEEALREEALTDLRANVDQVAWLAEAAYKNANEEKWKIAHELLLMAQQYLENCLGITRKGDIEP